MSFEIPDPATIQKRLEAEASLALGSQHAALPGTPENMIARITTIAAWELYGYIANLAMQILPPTASGAFLERHGTFWLGSGRKPPSPASGPVVVTGTPGTVIEAGTILSRADGALYSFTADVLIGGGGTGEGTVASEAAGAAANLPGGVQLNLSAPVIGVGGITVAADGITGGADRESDDFLLQRITDRVQNPPRGGALHDYEAWAEEVPGVTRAWAKQGTDGVVTVDVTFVMDEKPGTIIPSAGEVAAVFEHIEALRPVGSRPNVFAPVLQPVDFEITISPNTAAIRQAVTAELADFFRRETHAKGMTLHLSRLSEAVSIAAGEHHHRIVEPDESLVLPFGTLPILGDITWSGA